MPGNSPKWIFLVLLWFSTSHFCRGNTHLEKIVKDLQNKVKELEKFRELDTETIRNLEEKVHRYAREGNDFSSNVFSSSETLSKFPRESRSLAKSQTYESKSYEVKDTELKQLDQELRNLRAELLPIISSDESGGSNLKSEAYYFRQEITKLRKLVEEGESRRKDETRAFPGQVTVRWLQKTVEDLRHEMKEMASSLNTSAALADKQRTETLLDLLRSDVSALGHRMDHARVDREKDAALIQQLGQDAEELRTKLQEFAMEQRKMALQLDSLREEFNEENLRNKKKNLASPALTEGGADSNYKKDKISRPKFRHNHWKQEIDNIYGIIENLEDEQSSFTRELYDVKKSQTLSTLKSETGERVCSELLSKIENFKLEQHEVNQRVEILEDIVNQTEHHTDVIQSSVNNITSTGIKKLHGSTMQLFEALERLESNHDRTAVDFRREMSKLNYNLSQIQSDLEELRDSQIASAEIIASIKNDIAEVQSDSKKNHLRILLVQSNFLNRTLQNSQLNSGFATQDTRISKLETKIQTLSKDLSAEKLDMELLHRQMRKKADEKTLSHWEKMQRKVREAILDIKQNIPKIKKHQENIEQELEKFTGRLPKDCTLNSSLEQASSKMSGVYLIQLSEHSTTEVYCDMETHGGQWTLIQRRSRGDISFDRSWYDYKKGFGNVESGDFWIGNDVIHLLTTSSDYALHIDLWDSMGKYSSAEYSTFRVLNESDNYRLVIAGYRGNASDAMAYHNAMSFSTPDKDNDASEGTHCGEFYGSGWWYNHCQFANLNGRYNTGMTWYNKDWQEWSQLSRVEMKIKPKKLVFPELV